MEGTNKPTPIEDEELRRGVQVEHQSMPIDIESPPESDKEHAGVSGANLEGKEGEGVSDPIAKIGNKKTKINP